MARDFEAGGPGNTNAVNPQHQWQAPDPWKHRSLGMSCATCMWFVEKARDTALVTNAPAPTPALGRCRRHAPTLNGYPAVFRTDWCGDHKLDENKL